MVTSGCSDNSIGKHATKHSRTTGHYGIRSFEPGADWRSWYADAAFEKERRLARRTRARPPAAGPTSGSRMVIVRLVAGPSRLMRALRSPSA